MPKARNRRGSIPSAWGASSPCQIAASVALNFAESPAGKPRSTVTPDQALFTAGLSSIAADAQAASARNAETMNKIRSEEHTSELQSLMRISYAVFCLKKKKK